MVVIKNVANNFTGYCTDGQLGKSRVTLINPSPEIGYVIIHYFIELAFVSLTTRCYIRTTYYDMYPHMNNYTVDVTRMYVTECASLGNRPVLSAVATVNCGAARLTLLTDYDFVSHRRPLNLTGDTSPVHPKARCTRLLFTAKPA